MADVDGRDFEAARRRRRELIERLNRNDERLRDLEERRWETGQPGRLSEGELEREVEMERERNRSRWGFGQIV